jgi:hypothetical protein
VTVQKIVVKSESTVRGAGMGGGGESVDGIRRNPPHMRAKLSQARPRGVMTCYTYL